MSMDIVEGFTILIIHIVEISVMSFHDVPDHSLSMLSGFPVQ